MCAHAAKLLHGAAHARRSACATRGGIAGGLADGEEDCCPWMEYIKVAGALYFRFLASSNNVVCISLSSTLLVSSPRFHFQDHDHRQVPLRLVFGRGPASLTRGRLVSAFTACPHHKARAESFCAPDVSTILLTVQGSAGADARYPHRPRRQLALHSALSLCTYKYGGRLDDPPAHACENAISCALLCSRRRQRS